MTIGLPHFKYGALTDLVLLIVISGIFSGSRLEA